MQLSDLYFFCVIMFGPDDATTQSTARLYEHSNGLTDLISFSHPPQSDRGAPFGGSL